MEILQWCGTKHTWPKRGELSSKHDPGIHMPRLKNCIQIYGLLAFILFPLVPSSWKLDFEAKEAAQGREMAFPISLLFNSMSNHHLDTCPFNTCFPYLSNTISLLFRRQAWSTELEGKNGSEAVTAFTRKKNENLRLVPAVGLFLTAGLKFHISHLVPLPSWLSSFLPDSVES